MFGRDSNGSTGLASSLGLSVGLVTCALFACACTASAAIIRCERAARSAAQLRPRELVGEAAYQATLAHVFLEEARELASEARYGEAIELARRSEAAAAAARIAPRSTAAPSLPAPQQRSR